MCRSLLPCLSPRHPPTGEYSPTSFSIRITSRSTAEFPFAAHCPFCDHRVIHTVLSPTPELPALHIIGPHIHPRSLTLFVSRFEGAEPFPLFISSHIQCSRQTMLPSNELSWSAVLLAIVDEMLPSAHWRKLSTGDSRKCVNSTT